MADDLFGEPHRRLVGGPDIGRGEGDAAHLRRRGIGELTASVPDIDVPQPRKAVDIAAALGIVQHRPLAFDHDQRLAMVVGVVQRVNQIAPVALDQLGGAVHDPLLRVCTLTPP